MSGYSARVSCLARPVLADTGWPPSWWSPRQLFGLERGSARRPGWGTVSGTKDSGVCLAAWRSTTVVDRPSVIQGLLALDPAYGPKSVQRRGPGRVVLGSKPQLATTKENS